MATRRHRRARRTRMMRYAIPGAAIIAAALILFFILRSAAGPRHDGTTAPIQTTAVPTAVPVSTASPAPSPTPTYTPAPSPSPQPTPENGPNVLSFYAPMGKSYSARKKLGDTYTAKWKKGKDIGSFEVVASDADTLDADGHFFGSIFGNAWFAFPDASAFRIGYTMRYTLDDGTEIRYTMLTPKYIEHTEYIECWMYDDYHQTPHKFYSHLKNVKGDTLITSIKLTCGSRIDSVQEIWLTAFVYASLDDFDADRNYTGDVSCTLHIVRS